MADTIQFKRGTTSQVQSIIPAIAEPVWDKNKKQLFIGDGVTAGGVPIATGWTEVIQMTAGVGTTGSLMDTDLTFPLEAGYAYHVEVELILYNRGSNHQVRFALPAPETVGPNFSSWTLTAFNGGDMSSGLVVTPMLLDPRYDDVLIQTSSSSFTITGLKLLGINYTTGTFMVQINEPIGVGSYLRYRRYVPPMR